MLDFVLVIFRTARPFTLSPRTVTPDVVFDTEFVARDGYEDLAITAKRVNGRFHAAFAA